MFDVFRRQVAHFISFFGADAGETKKKSTCEQEFAKPVKLRSTNDEDVSTNETLVPDSAAELADLTAALALADDGPKPANEPKHFTAHPAFQESCALHKPTIFNPDGSIPAATSGERDTVFAECVLDIRRLHDASVVQDRLAVFTLDDAHVWLVVLSQLPTLLGDPPRTPVLARARLSASSTFVFGTSINSSATAFRLLLLDKMPLKMVSQRLPLFGISTMPVNIEELSDDENLLYYLASYDPFPLCGSPPKLPEFAAPAFNAQIATARSHVFLTVALSVPIAIFVFFEGYFQGGWPLVVPYLIRISELANLVKPSTPNAEDVSTTETLALDSAEELADFVAALTLTDDGPTPANQPSKLFTLRDEF
ncbi:hypothetical protein B0H13DRAFT_2370190 [Mycena leptocephala]|nr:hypothetical protein B0H13DRAFT_2370190 [Mycena leptocephala]